MGAITQIQGRALPMRGDDIDTDRIMPARFLKGISFEGRQGSGGRTLLASPLTAAAAAVTGVITDPRTLLEVAV